MSTHWFRERSAMSRRQTAVRAQSTGEPGTHRYLTLIPRRNREVLHIRARLAGFPQLPADGLRADGRPSEICRYES